MSAFTWEHLLYRLFDNGGALLYIGRTAHFPTRMATHSTAQSWWSEVARATVETFPTFEALDEAERTAIRKENPRYNAVRYASPVVNTVGTPRSKPKATEVPTDDPVRVSYEDAVCAVSWLEPLELKIVLATMRTYSNAHKPRRVRIGVEMTAGRCKLPVGQTRFAVQHLVRAGWLIDNGDRQYEFTIPRAVFNLGSDACQGGCGHHTPAQC